MIYINTRGRLTCVDDGDATQEPKNKEESTYEENPSAESWFKEIGRWRADMLK